MGNIDPLVTLHYQLDELQTITSQATMGVNAWIRYVDSKLDADPRGVVLFHKDDHAEVVTEAQAHDDKYKGLPRLALAVINSKRREIALITQEHALLKLRSLVNTFLRRYAERLVHKPIVDDSWFSYDMVAAYTDVDPSKMARFDVVMDINTACLELDRCIEHSPEAWSRVHVTAGLIRAVGIFGGAYDEAFRKVHPEVTL